MAELHELSALEAAAAVRARAVSPVELVTHALERIDAVDHAIGAFVTVTADAALAQARAAEKLAGTEGAPPLLGVPTAIKDLNQTAGVPTKLGSRAFESWVPEVDDHVVALLREAGTISLGKTAAPEFGLPCYTETDIGPPTRTPWDLARSAGGSSGGAGAAVAAGLVSFAQGSDGGGSIRIPASACGVVGLKTSRGRVSKGPIDVDASRLSVLGPLARTVRDAAAFLDAVAIAQPGDPDPCPPLPPGETFVGWCERDPGRLRIGRTLDAVIEHELDPQVRAAWEDATALLAGLGHEVVDIPSPVPPEALPYFETVWTAGAAAIPIPAERAELVRPLTAHLRARGAEYSAADEAFALGQLNLIARRAVVATASFDALLYPTLAQLPQPIGWFSAGGDPAADFERQKRFTPYTAMFNMTGQPAISLPLSISVEGLPIGIMLVGRPRGDAALLALAAQLEAARPWPGFPPTLRTGGLATLLP